MSSFNISRFTSMGSRPKYTFKKGTSSKKNLPDANEENSAKAVGNDVERDSFNDTVDTIQSSEQKHEGSTFILGQIISQNELALAQSNTKYDIFDEFLELGIKSKSVSKTKNDVKIKKKRGVDADNDNTIVASDKNSKKREAKETTRRALKDKSNKKDNGTNQIKEVVIRSNLVTEKNLDKDVLQKNKGLEKDEKRVDFKIYDDNSELIVSSATEPVWDIPISLDNIASNHFHWRDMKPIMTSTPVKVTDDSQYHTDNVSSASLEEIGNILPSDDDAEDKEALKSPPQTADSQKEVEKQSVESLESKGDQNRQENLDYDSSPDPLTLPMRPEDQRLPPPPKGD
ncbi:13605_t:CDS:2 [Dentiscutata erythropus]|uniref:13605_t:CDS:1 n=1 Tax=Dentiscutata erythropus TaxID=1348616 RepID=A0A9N9E1R7_9GLOM|nr:13605_t:CDS:2 [Dentiscutata erythropus]